MINYTSFMTDCISIPNVLYHYTTHVESNGSERFK